MSDVPGEKRGRDRLFTPQFFVISLVNFIIFVGFQMLLPTLPVQAESLGASEMLIGIVSGSISFASILTRPAAGPLLDSRYQKTVFIVGIALFGLITLTYGFVGSVAFLILFRFLHGIGWGTASTGSNTVASEIIPRSRFGEGIGYFTLSTSLAMAIGPALGLTIMEATDFRTMTYVSFGIMMAALVLALTIPGKLERMRRAGIAAPEKALADPLHTPSFSPRDITKRTIERSAIRPAIIMALVSSSVGVVNGFLALYALEFDVTNVASYFVVFSLAMIVSRPPTGKILDRYGAARTVVPGLVLTIAGLIMLSQAGSMFDLYIVAVLYGIGFAAVQTSLQSLAVRDVPISRRGVATSTFFIGFDFGIGAGAVLGGLVAQNFGYSIMYGALAGLAVIALVYFIMTIARNGTGGPSGSGEPQELTPRG